MNKTLNQVIIDKTENTVFGNILDAATNAELKDYFLDRYVCFEDEDRFIRHFQRNLRIYKSQYNSLLRNQNIEFDPMITRYLERQVINKVTNTETENSTGSKNSNRLVTNGGTVTLKTDNIETGTGNSTEQGSAGYTDNLHGTTQSSHSGNENHQDRTRTVLSAFPQANVSSNTGVSLDAENVPYNYATSMTDVKNKGNSSNGATDNGSHSDTNTGTSNRNNNVNSSSRNVLDGTQTQTNNSNSNRADTESNSKNVTNNGEENSNLKERFTGRENYDSATLLTHAREYIATSNAFMKFLIPNISKCFISDLRYGEE